MKDTIIEIIQGIIGAAVVALVGVGLIELLGGWMTPQGRLAIQLVDVAWKLILLLTFGPIVLVVVLGIAYFAVAIPVFPLVNITRWLYSRLRGRPAPTPLRVFGEKITNSPADKHKRAPKAERQDKPPAPIKHPQRPSAKRAPVKRTYKSQHRSETAEAERQARRAFTPDEWRRLGDLRAAVIDGSMGVDEARRLLAGNGQQGKPPALDKAPPAAKFNREKVYRNGQWMTRSEAERQDKHKREPVKRIYQSQHRSETAEAARQALTPDEWRRFEAFKPSEWHRLGDLRAAVIDGSMGVDEARRLLAGGYGWPPVARPFAKREPVKDGSMSRDDARRLLSIYVRSADLPRQQAMRKIAMGVPLSKIVEWAENGSINKREAGLLLDIKQGWTSSDAIWLMQQGHVFWQEGLIPESPMFPKGWSDDPSRARSHILRHLGRQIKDHQMR